MRVLTLVFTNNKLMVVLAFLTKANYLTHVFVIIFSFKKTSVFADKCVQARQNAHTSGESCLFCSHFCQQKMTIYSRCAHTRLFVRSIMDSEGNLSKTRSLRCKLNMRLHSFLASLTGALAQFNVTATLQEFPRVLIRLTI